jgi:hypothetical protein
VEWYRGSSPSLHDCPSLEFIKAEVTNNQDPMEAFQVRKRCRIRYP